MVLERVTCYFLGILLYPANTTYRANQLGFSIPRMENRYWLAYY